jgi:hypothetical protein
MSKILVPSSARSDPSHIQRLKGIAQWYLPRESSQEWIDFRLKCAAERRNPAYRQHLKEVSRTGIATAAAISNNGAGLPADSGIREFGDEYNRRVIRHGLHYLPLSFNIFEALFDYRPKYAIFLPLNERDHVCKLASFLTFLGTAEITSRALSQNRFEDDVVYNYSFSDEPGKLLFGPAGKEFSVASASIVRRGEEITVMCLVGVSADLREESTKIHSINIDGSRNSDKPNLRVDENLKAEAVALQGAQGLGRKYVALRFHAPSASIQARYVFADHGNTWGIWSDDPISIAAIKGSLGSTPELQTNKELDAHSEAFAFATRLLFLPEYFLSSASLVSSEKSVTNLAAMSGDAKKRRLYEKALRSQIVYERRVSVYSGDTHDASVLVFPPLQLKVEVDGYWKKLALGEYGIGMNGERILGRTWVRQTLSTRQTTIESGPLIVEPQREFLPILEEDAGYIYVMRNASHQLDIFKVGLTRRDVNVRARELSSSTGVPDHFLPVQYWWVPSVRYAEKRIHELLDEYRLRDSREFFQAEFPVIRRCVELVINELAGHPIS